MGTIGARVSIRARAFEMSLLVYDPYIPESHVTALGGRWASLNEVFAESGFVTLHCPLTHETKHMVGERELSLMKPSAYFINAARVGIVDEDALYRLLRDGRIAGAALDAMDDEPPAKAIRCFNSTR